jgi:hypothetical protein
VKNETDKDGKQDWTPDKYVQILKNSLDDYEKEHPHWRIEVLVSMIQWSLRSLKHYIEDCHDTAISWESPFVELHYPVDWNWESPRIAESADHVHSGITFGNITKQNTSDKEIAVKTLAEIMVRRLNTLALESFTNGAWFEIQNNYYTPVLPLELSQELNAIKGKRSRREVFEQLVRPFSIGAASIDYLGMKFEDGARVPKRLTKQLANINNLIDIQRIGISGEVNGRKIEMSLIFQIHPLIANYDEKKAYHPITIGLFIEPRIVGNDVITDTPSDWPKDDRATLWRELLQEIDKITDRLIPKSESQSSEIFWINAKLEIPLASSHPEERNAAIKKILDNLSQAGQVQEISVKPAERAALVNLPRPKEIQTKDEKVPTSFEEGLVSWIWKSRFRWFIIIPVALAIAVFAVYIAQPDEVKIRILKYLGFYAPPSK